MKQSDRSNLESVIADLKRELEATRLDLQRSIQEMESTNEELRASNEELQSMNEELLSTNRELHASQEQLATREAQLRTITDAIPPAFAFVDRDMRYRFSNAAHAAHWQHSIDEIVGKNVVDVIGEKTFREIQPYLIDAFNGLQQTYEMQLTFPGVCGKRTKEVTYVPQKNPDGSIGGCHVVLMDITERKRTEQELRESRRELAVGVEVAKLGLGRVDFRSNSVALTAEAAAMYGISDNAITISRDKFHQTYHPDDREEVVQLVQACLNSHGDGHCDLEHRIVMPSGEVRWINARKQVSFDSSVNPPIATTAILAAQDITDRKRAELNLAFLSDLQSQLNAISSVSELMQLAAQQTAEYLGLSRCLLVQFDENAQYADIVYEHPSESQPSLLGKHLVKDFHSQAEREKLLAGKQFYLGDTQHPDQDPDIAAKFREYQIGAFCNSAYVTEQRIRFVVSALKSHAYQWRPDELNLLQEIANRICVLIERARAETELADRENHLRRVIDNTVAMIGILDREGNLLEANQTALRAGGLQRDEVIGKPFWECHWWNYDDDVATQLREEFARAINGETTRHDVVIRIGQDDRTTIDFMLAPIRDADGKITYVIPSGVDIKDRKAAEDLVRHNAAQLADKQAKLIALLADYERAESKLQVLFDNGYYYTGIIELDGTTTDINEIALRQLGASRDETIHRRIWDCPWWGNNEEVKQKLRDGLRLAAVGKVYREDLPFWLPDGTERIIDFIFTPARDQHGEVVFVVANGSDVTEVRHGQEELRKREQHLKLSLQAGRLGTWEWNPTTDQIKWSEELQSIFGMSETRQNISFDDILQSIHPEDREDAAQHLRSVVQGSESSYRFDCRIVREDNGKTSWVENLGLISRNKAGIAKLVTSITRDVTERKQTELALAEGKERLTMALRAGGMAVWEWSDEGVFWEDSMYELLGLSPECKRNVHTLMQVIHPDDLKRMSHAWRQTVNGNASLDEEFRVLRPDGSVHWIAGVGERVLGDNGESNRILGLIWDITEQRELQDSLQEARAQAEAASESKSEFLANMSHEIRTPMTAILGYIDLIAEQIEHPEALEHVRTIRCNGDFLLDIINDILDLSKIEAGKLDIASERFSPNRLIEDVRSIMEVRATEGGLNLDVDYEGEIPSEVVSDPKRLKQILINLVGNAIKFTPSGEVRLRIRYQPEDQRLRIDIVDTGIGMKPEQLTRLFKPFTQGDSSVTRHFGGTGLGLAISQRLAKMLGGTISVDSVEGQGSTFSLTIATGDIRGVDMIKPMTMIQPDRDEEPMASITLHCSVLVVDDRRDIRFLSKAMLTKAGATVDEAEDGVIAIKKVKSRLDQGQSYDLILLDMQMPKLDGYQTAEKLRRMGFSGPIIALTADAMQGDMSRCIEQGCNDYLSKPIHKATMLQMVSRYVGSISN
ncbi:PAS domain S-box protein [Novipirellula caenicola]|uniref:histidine kinase n=1 Tax=Novipirellula caenicola TaxID=1536901 RepID=A0ABP9VM04_9BACT